MSRWATALIIACAAILAYYPILFSGFVSDDFMILYNIKHYKITDVGSQGMFFRPLVYISFAIDSFISGDRALWFHSVNLFLHIIASLGVAACADILLRKRYAGLTAGLVFALHPVHPEATPG